MDAITSKLPSGISVKSLSLIAFLIIGVIALFQMIGNNDSGYRSVVQYPNGTMEVMFESGPYIAFFGKVTEYPDVITYDYDEGATTRSEGSVSDDGVSVRYQDGGTGTVYGKERFRLPSDTEQMLKIHREFRSAEGVGNRMIRPLVKEAHNLTAGLMSSEDAYAQKRGTYINWAQDQIANGKYVTELQAITIRNEESGKDETRQVPVIKVDKGGNAMRYPSMLAEYGITTSSGQVTKWDFEPKTLAQISAKREATMAIITAKAEAERAKQDALTLEAKGMAEVIKAKYEREVMNAKDISDAERAVKVAAELRKEAEQKKLAAAEYKLEQILRGEGDAAYKSKVMQADGALQQKLDVYERVNNRYAEAIEKQKWVPEIVMGSSSSGTTASALVDLFTVKTAKELNLDMSMKTRK